MANVMNSQKRAAIVRCWACLAREPTKEEMLASVDRLAADSHLLVHEIMEAAFLDKPYPTGDPELDVALESVKKNGRYLLVTRIEIKPSLN